ncbi:MAG TPA: M48 family metallopeptidase [Bacteroidota bacterium]|nr:M48 family metallopeptidase [Bacteroidota bacterium]
MQHVAHVTPSEPPPLQETQVSRSSASPPPHDSPLQNQPHQSAKAYSRTKLIVGIVGTVIFFAYSFAMVAFGGTRLIESGIRSVLSNDYLVFLGFASVFGLIELILTLPLRYYSGYHLEHKFHLSNQTLIVWFREGVKGMVVGLVIGTPVLLIFFYCLQTYGEHWWVPVGIAMFLFSVLFARLAPVLIFPLFYKFQPLADGSLKSKLIALCKRGGVKIVDVYVFDMSKNTKKANAAFTGIGKSKRILLGDTLVANCTDEEIETVVAHELGHHTLNHLWRMMLLGTVTTFAGLWLTAWLYEASIEWFGFSSITQPAALPLLSIWFGIYSILISPLTNGISRMHEYAADRFAVRFMQNNEVFLNALRKLSTINLADPEPPPLVEFWSYSHPPLKKRINAIAELR